MRVIYKHPSEKIKNLSPEVSYEVIGEEGNYYLLLNNIEKEAHYAKKLFEVVPTEPHWHIGNIQYSDGYRVSVLRNNELMGTMIFPVGPTGISCGLAFFGNIASNIQFMREMEVPAARIVDLMYESLDSCLESHSIRFGIISINREEEETVQLIMNRFGERVTSSPWRQNPNSGNQICVIVIEALDPIPDEQSEDDEDNS